MAGSGRSAPRLSAEWFGRAALAGFAALLLVSDAAAGDEGLVPYEVVGDAIPAPLTRTAGDPARGRAIVGNRQLGLCLLCHSGPFPEDRLQGTLAPSLAGVGSRLSAGQLRLRIVDASRVNPNTIMRPYYRTQDLTRVAPSYSGRPILDAGQVEDVVAFLATLTE
jgi:sulfur-oxidizing protein SoxX